MPFFPPASRFKTFLLGHAQKTKFGEFLEEKVTYIFRLLSVFSLLLFCLSFFSFSYLFAAVIDLLLGLLPVQKRLRKPRDRHFLPRSSHVYWQEILLPVFHSNFRAFSCIFQASSSRSLWSGYHWKDLFLQQNLSIDNLNFGQRWWRLKWNKAQHSSRPVTGSLRGRP